MDPRAGLVILEKRKTLTLTRIQTLDHEACSLVTILIMLSQLDKSLVQISAGSLPLQVVMSWLSLVPKFKH